MKRNLQTLLLPLVLILSPLAAATGLAAGGTAAAPPSLEDRVKGLEAYFHNADPAHSAVTQVAGPGHNAWLMASAAMVLFMSLPGLALFYGGLVRAKNVLSVLAQCMGIAAIVGLLWWAFGYSLVFGRNFDSPFIGGSEYFFLSGVGGAPNTDYAFWTSQSVFAMFQMMFAVITPALMIGAIAERMRFAALMAFVGAWMLIAYFPLAHMTWGANGCFNGLWNPDAALPAIDFAGGTVVHMSSGWSALLLCIILGHRTGFGREAMPPHSMVLCMMGTGMLWFGWYGFNAGSALAADGIAGTAFLATTLSATAGAATWAVAEGCLRSKPSLLGFCSGAVAGLVAITPAAGFVGASAAVAMGVAGAAASYAFVVHIKERLRLDDSLDTFGIHGVSGTLGSVLTGLLASPEANPGLLSAPGAALNGLADSVRNGSLWWTQLKVGLITIAISLAATALIAFALRRLMHLRPGVEHERQGLDTVEHGEAGYMH